MSKERKNTAYCRHIKLAEEAFKAELFAQEIKVSAEKLKKKLKNKISKQKIDELASDEGSISIFVLPGNHVVVPSCTEQSAEAPLPYLHLKKDICHFSKCKEKTSKLHSLIKKRTVIHYY